MRPPFLKTPTPPVRSINNNRGMIAGLLAKFTARIRAVPATPQRTTIIAAMKAGLQKRKNIDQASLDTLFKELGI